MTEFCIHDMPVVISIMSLQLFTPCVLRLNLASKRKHLAVECPEQG
jgi:hypothetical protein